VAFSLRLMHGRQSPAPIHGNGRPFDYSCETETGFGFNPEPVSLNRIRPN